jgi:hypothetical protein
MASSVIKNISVKSSSKSLPLTSATAGANGYLTFDFSEFANKTFTGGLACVGHLATGLITGGIFLVESTGTVYVPWYAPKAFTDNSNTVNVTLYYI